MEKIIIRGMRGEFIRDNGEAVDFEITITNPNSVIVGEDIVKQIRDTVTFDCPKIQEHEDSDSKLNEIVDLCNRLGERSLKTGMNYDITLENLIITTSHVHGDTVRVKLSKSNMALIYTQGEDVLNLIGDFLREPLGSITFVDDTLNMKVSAMKEQYNNLLNKLIEEANSESKLGKKAMIIKEGSIAGLSVRVVWSFNAPIEACMTVGEIEFWYDVEEYNRSTLITLMIEKAINS